MTPEVFAEWMRAQGNHVIRTESSYWHSQGPRVYQAFPYHWIIEPNDAEIDQLVRRHRIIGLRYSTPLHSDAGKVSYHAVYEQAEYRIEDLSKYSRRDARRGLKSFAIEPISLERLATEGWSLQLDTLDRQGRNLGFAKKTWVCLCLAAGGLPGFEAWGAFANDSGSLAASVITFQMEDRIYMLYQQCLRDYMGDYVNNALSYTVTKTMIDRPEIDSILYGLHSLDAPPSVDEFKFRMGYTARPVRQRVVFHPLLRPLFNSLTHCGLQKIQSVWPGNPFVAKAEGMVRFYREGTCPLSEQAWPKGLTDYRDKLISDPNVTAVGQTSN